MLRRVLILSHRYVGIPMSVVFVIWFASGIIMIYTGGMPSLGERARIEGLERLNLAAVRVSAREAIEAAGFEPDGVTLFSVMGRPAYRLDAFRGHTIVFADTGELLGEIGADAAREIASRFTGIATERIRYVRTVTEPDQWTLTLRGRLPLLKLAAADRAGTEIYVSPAAAEVALVTDTASRALAWAGAIPHWFYVTPLRANQPAWYWTVVVVSIIGCVLAALGLILAVTQFRRPRPFRLRAAIPYTGWMRWHYILGAVFGVFALTWVFSGLLSMEPLDWTRMDDVTVRRDVFSGGPLQAGRLDAIEPGTFAGASAGRTLKELEWLRIQGEPYYLARYAPAPSDPHTAGPVEVLLDAGTLEPRTQPFTTRSLIARLERAVPEHPIVERALLTEHDAYYYARGYAPGTQAPLPVLRVKFGDPAATWVYVDPARSRVLAQLNRLERVERWIYNGLHSLDFAFWYDKRPLWDIGMIVLSLGALASSVIGLYLGSKRLRRGAARLLSGRRAA